jgi:hypothetical protein
MDDMDPQMFSVLAGRVALEGLDTVDREAHEAVHRRSGSLVRLTRLVAARFTDRFGSRGPRATHDAAPLPLRTGLDG